MGTIANMRGRRLALKWYGFLFDLDFLLDLGRTTRRTIGANVVHEGSFGQPGFRRLGDLDSVFVFLGCRSFDGAALGTTGTDNRDGGNLGGMLRFHLCKSRF
jgi:hypothetical protein